MALDAVKTTDVGTTLDGLIGRDATSGKLRTQISRPKRKTREWLLNTARVTGYYERSMQALPNRYRPVAWLAVTGACRPHWGRKTRTLNRAQSRAGPLTKAALLKRPCRLRRIQAGRTWHGVDGGRGPRRRRGQAGLKRQAGHLQRCRLHRRFDRLNGRPLPGQILPPSLRT